MIKKFSFYEVILALLFLAFLILLPITVFNKNKEPNQLPELGAIPSFALTNQDEVAIQSESLSGSVLVVNFIFTSCPDTCPLLTGQMKKIQEKLRGKGFNKVHLLSISVDPDTDTPEVLKKYAKEHSLDLSNWHFLTGRSQEIQKIVVGGFKVSMQQFGVTENETKDYSIMDVTHGEQFVVVDRQSRIRAYRSARSPSDLEKIVSVVAKLI